MLWCGFRFGDWQMGNLALRFVFALCSFLLVELLVERFCMRGLWRCFLLGLVGATGFYFVFSKSIFAQLF